MPTTQITNTSSRIGEIVRRFFAERIFAQKLEFHLGDLHKYVSRRLGGKVAPGSPDRVMRMLRKQGMLNYEVLSRASSKYLAMGVTL